MHGLLAAETVGCRACATLPPLCPLPLCQGYLIITGVSVAYVFTWIPEWTTWILLVAMAAYDIIAGGRAGAGGVWGGGVGPCCAERAHAAWEGWAGPWEKLGWSDGLWGRLAAAVWLRLLLGLRWVRGRHRPCP